MIVLVLLSLAIDNLYYIIYGLASTVENEFYIGKKPWLCYNYFPLLLLHKTTAPHTAETQQLTYNELGIQFFHERLCFLSFAARLCSDRHC